MQIDESIFIYGKQQLPFVTDDSKLTISNSAGETWEFPYETNKAFELDSDKRCVMLIEEGGYPRLLLSKHLSVRPSPRYFYHILMPTYFTGVGVFDPDLVFEDEDGLIYTANVAKHKIECIMEDDDFHKRIVSLCDMIKESPTGSTPRLQIAVMDLEAMDRRGDPSRFMPTRLVRALEEGFPPDFNDELIREIEEAVEAYKKLRRV